MKKAHLLNDWKNFNETFRKDKLMIILKVTKTGFHPLFRRYIFGKNTESSN